MAAYRELIGLRRSLPALTDPAFDAVSCMVEERLFVLCSGEVTIAVNFGDAPVTVAVDDDLRLLFSTPTRPVLAGGLLDLQPHAGALLVPA
jgi:maltooligosyltrehalose trehalohydrolase